MNPQYCVLCGLAIHLKPDFASEEEALISLVFGLGKGCDNDDIARQWQQRRIKRSRPH
jgi:hypothetical protein